MTTSQTQTGQGSSARRVAPTSRGDLVVGVVPRGLGVGRSARHPTAIPWRGWWAVLRRVAREARNDRISLIAAGCAFYATLSLFPAITMLISIYGLVFAPRGVAAQLHLIQGLLPPAAFQLIAGRIQMLVTRPAQTLSFGLAFGVLLGFWSASTGTRSMLWALNVAYEEREKRGYLRFNAVALAITLIGILGTVLALALLLALPPAIRFLGLAGAAGGVIRALSLFVLVLFILVGLSLLYRFGPSRRPAGWHWVTPGAVVGTLLWLLASVLFSIYVGRFASYDATYGPIGAAVAVMGWFYVSALAVLLGAELNAELELQTAEDTTAGAARPIGERGAFVADHVAG